MKFPAIAFAFVLMTGAALPPRKAPPHTADWIVLGRDRPTETITLKRGANFELTRIVPRALYRLDSDAIVANGRVAVPKGALMVPVDGGTASACELLRDVGSAFSCLTDSDGDGRFDAFFGTQVFNEVFFGSNGDDGGFEAIVSPVGRTSVDPKTEAPHVGLEFTYKGLSRNRLRFELCTSITRDKVLFGKSRRKNTSISCLTAPPEFALDRGGAMNLFGNSLNFAGTDDKAVHISISYSTRDADFSTSVPRLNWIF